MSDPLDKEILESEDPSFIYEKVRQKSLRADLKEIYSPPNAPKPGNLYFYKLSSTHLFVLLGLESNYVFQYELKSSSIQKDKTVIETSTAGGFIGLYEDLDKQVSTLFLKKTASSVFVLFNILANQKNT